MDADQLACESVYYALFRAVQIAELEGPEAAVEWAEDALTVASLRQGLVDGVEEHASAGRFSRN